jgi:hypothetical protein
MAWIMPRVQDGGETAAATHLGLFSPLGGSPYPANENAKEVIMLLVLAIVLLIIAVAGGVVVHPILFALAILALVVFFSGRRGAVL